MSDNQTKEILGYWLDAIGQTMSALAITPSILKDNDLSLQLDLWGNVLQGTGTALVADIEETFTFDKLGNQLESIGNLVTVMGILAPFSEEEKKGLEKKGDMIETFGVIVSLPDELKDGFTLELFFDVYGHLLSVVEFKEVDEELIDIIAEWSQVIAAILSLMNAMKVES